MGYSDSKGKFFGPLAGAFRRNLDFCFVEINTCFRKRRLPPSLCRTHRALRLDRPAANGGRRNGFETGQVSVFLSGTKIEHAIQSCQEIFSRARETRRRFPLQFQREGRVVARADGTEGLRRTASVASGQTTSTRRSEGARTPPLLPRGSSPWAWAPLQVTTLFRRGVISPWTLMPRSVALRLTSAVEVHGRAARSGQSSPKATRETRSCRSRGPSSGPTIINRLLGISTTCAHSGRRV